MFDIATAATIASVSFPSTAIALAVINAWRGKGKQQFPDQGMMPGPPAVCLLHSGVEKDLKNLLDSCERIEAGVGRCTTCIEGMTEDLAGMEPRLRILEKEAFKD